MHSRAVYKNQYVSNRCSCSKGFDRYSRDISREEVLYSSSYSDDTYDDSYSDHSYDSVYSEDISVNYLKKYRKPEKIEEKNKQTGNSGFPNSVDDPNNFTFNFTIPSSTKGKDIKLNRQGFGKGQMDNAFMAKLIIDPKPQPDGKPFKAHLSVSGVGNEFKTYELKPVAKSGLVKSSQGNGWKESSDDLLSSLNTTSVSKRTKGGDIKSSAKTSQKPTSESKDDGELSKSIDHSTADNKKGGKPGDDNGKATSNVKDIHKEDTDATAKTGQEKDPSKVAGDKGQNDDPAKTGDKSKGSKQKDEPSKLQVHLPVQNISDSDMFPSDLSKTTDETRSKGSKSANASDKCTDQPNDNRPTTCKSCKRLKFLPEDSTQVSGKNQNESKNSCLSKFRCPFGKKKQLQKTIDEAPEGSANAEVVTKQIDSLVRVRDEEIDKHFRGGGEPSAMIGRRYGKGMFGSSSSSLEELQPQPIDKKKEPGLEHWKTMFSAIGMKTNYPTQKEHPKPIITEDKGNQKDSESTRVVEPKPTGIEKSNQTQIDAKKHNNKISQTFEKWKPNRFKTDKSNQKGTSDTSEGVSEPPKATDEANSVTPPAPIETQGNETHSSSEDRQPKVRKSASKVLDKLKRKKDKNKGNQTIPNTDQEHSNGSHRIVTVLEPKSKDKGMQSPRVAESGEDVEKEKEAKQPKPKTPPQVVNINDNANDENKVNHSDKHEELNKNKHEELNKDKHEELNKDKHEESNKDKHEESNKDKHEELNKDKHEELNKDKHEELNKDEHVVRIHEPIEREEQKISTRPERGKKKNEGFQGNQLAKLKQRIQQQQKNNGTVNYTIDTPVYQPPGRSAAARRPSSTSPDKKNNRTTGGVKPVLNLTRMQIHAYGLENETTRTSEFPPKKYTIIPETLYPTEIKNQ